MFSAYNLFKLKPGFTATPILIALNTLVFVIMVLKGLGFEQFYTRDLIPWGAIYQPAVKQGEWWRLLTGMFLHGGAFHLLMNMLSLYLAGIFLEGFMGSKKFAVGYLVTGIAAGLISMAWHDKPVVAVGASGAIFGLYGILLSLVISKKLEAASKKVMLVFLAATAGYSLLMGFLSEGIDNSAHLGGLVSGLIFGALFAKSVKHTANII
jgi:membrane associated rhomboid family serine protease